MGQAEEVHTHIYSITCHVGVCFEASINDHLCLVKGGSLWLFEDILNIY